MRQTKYLITEAKNNTNTTDNEAISDLLCCQLLNRSQDFIMGELYNRNIKSNIFRGTQEITITPGTDTYDLPLDIYAVNAISSVSRLPDYGPVRQISEKNRGQKTGYFVAKNKIIFSPPQNSSFTSVSVSYTKKLPKLSVKYGTVASKTATTLTLNVGYGDMSMADDRFTVIDSSGTIILSNLAFTQAAGVITMASTTGITVGDTVVPGAYTSTHSQLPDECESSLVFMLEKLIQARISSSDISIGTILSSEQIQQIADMFTENTGDDFMPPILEYSEWV